MLAEAKNNKKINGKLKNRNGKPNWQAKPQGTWPSKCQSHLCTSNFYEQQVGERGRERELHEQWPISNDNATMHSSSCSTGQDCTRTRLPPADFRLRMTLSTHDSWWLPLWIRLPLLLLLLLATNAKHFIKSSVHINQTRLPTAAAAPATWRSNSSMELHQRLQWHIDLTSSDNSVTQKCNQCAVVNPIKLPRWSNWWLCSPMGQNKCVPLEVEIIKRNVQCARRLNTL